MSGIFEYINKHISGNSIVLECGGHTGTDTLRLLNHFKDGMVYTLEANKTLYDRHFKEMDVKNCKTFNVALSDRNGDIEFYLDCNKDGDAGASSILKSTPSYLHNHIHDERKITVQTTTLRDFMKNNNIEKIDLLWLDMEGYEYYVLKESKDILDNIKYIYTEVNFQQFRSDGKLYSDIISLLSDSFEDVAKWEQGDMWGRWQGNVLFKHR